MGHPRSVVGTELDRRALTHPLKPNSSRPSRPERNPLNTKPKRMQSSLSVEIAHDLLQNPGSHARSSRNSSGGFLDDHHLEAVSGAGGLLGSQPRCSTQASFSPQPLRILEVPGHPRLRWVHMYGAARDVRLAPGDDFEFRRRSSPAFTASATKSLAPGARQPLPRRAE